MGEAHAKGSTLGTAGFPPPEQRLSTNLQFVVRGPTSSIEAQIKLDGKLVDCSFELKSHKAAKLIVGEAHAKGNTLGTAGFPPPDQRLSTNLQFVVHGPMSFI